ncbi:hypothetical protein D3C76_134770 [compost metagenome]
MNRMLLDSPARTAEYREGCEARRCNEPLAACPYGMHMLLERSLWLAGHHDTDMAAERRRAA